MGNLLDPRRILTLMNLRLLAACAGVMTFVKTALFSVVYALVHNTAWEIK
jgi:hypothetical protein